MSEAAPAVETAAAPTQAAEAQQDPFSALFPQEPAQAPKEAKPEPEKVEAPKEAPKPKPDLMARLVAREARRKSELAALQKEKAELEKLRSLEPLKPAAEKWQALEQARASGDMTSVLELLGLDVAAVNEAFLKGNGKVAPSVQSQIASALKERDAAQAKASAEAQAAQEQAARARVTAQVAQLADLELVNALGHQDEVFELMRQTYEATGKLISVEDAGRQVEAFLDSALAKKASKKAPAPAAAAEPAPKPSVAPASAAKTLSSSMGASAAGTPDPKSSVEIDRAALEWFKEQTAKPRQ